MSPVTVCLLVIACAACAVAGPIKSTAFHLQNQEIALKSASEQSTVIDSTRITDLSIGTVSIPEEREMTSHRRIRRNIMKNGKCAQGYIKIGNTCMSCKVLELDDCD